MYRLQERFIFLMTWLLIYTSLCCQGNTKKEYTLYDTLPELRTGNMLNYPTDSMNISDIKGKTIILDFWNTSCMPCVEAFPIIDSLQEIFKDKVQFILVNKESKDSTLRFFAKRKKIKRPTVPMITGDQLLTGMFPAKGYPYHIWVSDARIIRYISFAGNTTKEHIDKYLQGEDLKLTDATKVETVKTIVDAERTEYYSFIARCQQDINIGKTEKAPVKNGSAYKTSDNCTSILSLFKKAYREYDKYYLDAPYSVRLEVYDTTMYKAPLRVNDYAAWERDYSYSYELQVPVSHAKDIYKIMQEDLKRYFKLEARIEKRKVKCLVLVMRKKSERLATKGGPSIETFSGSTWLKPTEDSIRVLQNQPFGRLIVWLSSWLSNVQPFFNRVTYTGNIDIALTDTTITSLDIPKLRSELRQYGLDLKEKRRKIPILILKNEK